jgi:Ca2+-binding RTX toxin-like protein
MTRKPMALVGAAIVVAFVFAAAPPPPASAQFLSPGCEDANDPFFDGLNLGGGWLFPRTFAAGERLTAAAAAPTQGGTPATVTLSVEGVVDQAAFPGTVQYKFTTPGDYGAAWQVHGGGEATWSVGCGRAALPQTTATCAGRVATIAGTAGADQLTGTRVSDVIAGGRGNDRILGAGGNDLICAGRGDDRVAAGGGNDRLLGGPGRDHLFGGPGRDRPRGGPGDDRVFGRR